MYTAEFIYMGQFRHEATLSALQGQQALKAVKK